ncbi:MAG: photosynthetic reaction center subunit H [Pseudomonadota bacterium]
MGIVEFTSGIDAAQIALYVFWVFFAGLILYLRREDRREGYPLESDTDGKIIDPGVIWVPEPKTFKLSHGEEVTAPNNKRDSDRELNARRLDKWPGSPSEPTGDPMLDAVGPGSYALRADEPEVNDDGRPKIVPMRTAPAFSIADGQDDPIGMTVVGADKKAAGTVIDAWVDTAENLIRYLEIELSPEAGSRRVLLPIMFAAIRARQRQVYVHAILSSQFSNVPGIASDSQVTLLEEDKVSAYYGAGHLYATPRRAEPYF